jgi:hypothetical protein
MATANGANEARPSADLLAEFSLDPEHLDQDVELAKRMVVVHQPEQWPHGIFCRNDRSRWPCRLYRWGHLVLWLSGWREAEIGELVRRAESGEMPWG